MPQLFETISSAPGRESGSSAVIKLLKTAPVGKTCFPRPSAHPGQQRSPNACIRSVSRSKSFRLWQEMTIGFPEMRRRFIAPSHPFNRCGWPSPGLKRTNKSALSTALSATGSIIDPSPIFSFGSRRFPSAPTGTQSPAVLPKTARVQLISAVPLPTLTKAEVGDIERPTPPHDSLLPSSPPLSADDLCSADALDLSSPPATGLSGRCARVAGRMPEGTVTSGPMRCSLRWDTSSCKANSVSRQNAGGRVLSARAPIHTTFSRRPDPAVLAAFSGGVDDAGCLTAFKEDSLLGELLRAEETPPFRADPAVRKPACCIPVANVKGYVRRCEMKRRAGPSETRCHSRACVQRARVD